MVTALPEKCPASAAAQQSRKQSPVSCPSGSVAVVITAAVTLATAERPNYLFSRQLLFQQLSFTSGDW